MKFSWDYFCRSRNQKATPLVGVAADEGWEAGVHCTACGQLSKSSVPWLPLLGTVAGPCLFPAALMV